MRALSASRQHVMRLERRVLVAVPLLLVALLGLALVSDVWMRPQSELKSNRKTILIAAAAVLGLGVLANAVFDPNPMVSIDRDDRPTIPSRPEARGAVTIDAEELYQAYREDEEAADRRFDDREMVVTGEFLRIVPDGAGWLVRFADGRPFHPLDLREGGCAVAHPCGEDRYEGEYRVAGPDELEVRWRLRGPAKDGRIASRYRRA